MKILTLIAGLTLASDLALAHGLHPVVANYGKGIELAADYLADAGGYSVTDFNNLIGTSTVQDTVRKIRVVRFRFTQALCTKDIEVYAKLDGSSILSQKVVGCVP